MGEKVWWAWGALLRKLSNIHGIHSSKANPGFLAYGYSRILVFLQPTDNIQVGRKVDCHFLQWSQVLENFQNLASTLAILNLYFCRTLRVTTSCQWSYKNLVIRKRHFVLNGISLKERIKGTWQKQARAKMSNSRDWATVCNKPGRGKAKSESKQNDESFLYLNSPAISRWYL